MLRSCLGIGVLFAAFAAPVQAQTGLVAAYAFDDAAGTSARDSSASNLNGALTGATWTAAGKFGSALSFNGGSSWVTVPDSALLRLTNGMTLEAWVQATSWTGWRTVIMKERPGGLSYALYASNTAGRPEIDIRRSNDVSVPGPAALPVNTWVHLAASYNGSTLVLYVNGAQVATGSQTGNITTSTLPLRIGGNSIWGEYFAGLIDEVRIYSRALTQAEIQTDMVTPIAGTPPPPDPTAPTVSISAPTAGATVSGTLSITANAADNIGVVGVQFKVDGANLGAEDTSTPYSASWNTTSLSNGPHTLTAVARDAAGNTATSSPVSVTVANVSTWTLSGAITPVAAGASATVSLSGAATLTVSADASGNYSFAGLSNGSYTVTPTKTNFTFTPPSQSVSIAGANRTGVNFVGQAIDTTPPSVTITAPTGGSTVTGTTTVTASASDNVAVAGVQFQLDGANLGVEDTAAPYSTSWNTTSIGNGLHTLRAVARDAAGNTTPSLAISVTVANTANLTGQWTAPFEIGLVAVNMSLMHTGKVLMFSGEFSTSAIERIWDPATNTTTLVPNPFYNLFCAGGAQLADGRILLVGGFDPPSLGAANANIFDPVTQSWSALPNMAYRRWYPTATTMPDGRVLVTSGAQTCLTCLADVPEIFDPKTNTFTQLPSARLGVPYYPFMYVLPDGRVLDAGANENSAASTVLDPATWTWTTVDPVVRDGHSSAMYEPGKIIKSGTASDSGGSGNAAPTAFVLDMTQPAPSWRQVASMANRRAFHNTTLLPDGTVLVTGGGTTLDGYDVTKSVFAAELWSPATETWQTLASAQVPRLYHSSVLLLPDGRVLTAGSGNDGPAVNQTRAEIFSPPYLFKGARPAVTAAPTVIQYGSAFAVETPDAASIARVSLIRPGSVTHAFDEDQRILSLPFTTSAGGLTIQAPVNANLAPPGYYMLFLVNSAGVPSVAPFVRLPSAADDTLAPTAPTGLAAQGGIGTALLTWTPSTDNTGVTGYNVHRSTTPGFVPAAVNRVGQAATTSFTDSGLPGATYFYVVTAQDVAGNVSAPSSETSAVVLADVTAPTVSITAPTDQAQVSGLVTISADASDDVGVAGVKFSVDGTPIGSEVTALPFRVTWNSASVSNDVHTLTADARDSAGHHTQTTILVSVMNAQQTAGLVAAYGFNEGAGVQTADASGQGNLGTLSSATWSATGRFGKALLFNGTSAWVTIADTPSLRLTTGMTIEAWVNPSSATGWRTVVLKELPPSQLAYSLYAENNATRPSTYIHTTSDQFVNGPTALPLNSWSHLAVTYDGSSLRLFLNGVQVATKTVSGAMAAGQGALRIGGNAVWGEYFRGLIDEVRIYNRALSSGEIQVDMGVPLP